MDAEDRYTQHFGIESAAGRIGLCICRECGATILLGDEQADSILLHDAWHEWLEAKR